MQRVLDGYGIDIFNILFFKLSLAFLSFKLEHDMLTFLEKLFLLVSEHFMRVA
jgi:hypothetical protein